MMAENKSRTPPETLDYKYPGTDNLVLVETALTNYNQWVADKFIRAFRARPNPGTRVLDFGSGIGTLSRIFYQKTGIRPDAFDIDAAHRAGLERLGFRTYAQVEDLPNDYDLIFTSNVLEHIEDDAGTLRAIRGKLSTNGTLLVYVPAFTMLWTFMDDMVEHYRRYSRKELVDKLRAAGYAVDYTGYCDSVGFILSLLFKHLAQRKDEMPLRPLRIFDRYLLPASKILDVPCRHLFGKNLYVIACKA
jgi:SAM-dependent methyltransferase